MQSDLYVGGRSQAIFPFTGMLDELKWWTVARTQEQICTDGGGAWNGAVCQY